MSRRSGAQVPVCWRICSVVVKARDGPDRLRATYQLLLEPRCRPSLTEDTDPAEPCTGKEAADARRRLCSRVH